MGTRKRPGKPRQPKDTKDEIIKRVTNTKTVIPQDVSDAIRSWNNGGKEAFSTLLDNFHLAVPDTRKIILQVISELSAEDRVASLKEIHRKLTDRERQFYANLFMRK